MLNITIEYFSFFMGILTACGFKFAWSGLRALAFYGRAIRQQNTKPALHIRKASMLIPFMIAGMMSGCHAFAASSSDCMIGWQEAPRQMFTLIGEMPNWACWLLVIVMMTFVFQTYWFIHGIAYRYGYQHGYRDTTATINAVGKDLHQRLTEEA